MKPLVIFDTECYHGYFLIAFMDVETGAVKTFEQREGSVIDILLLRKFIKKYTLIGFNCLNYDLPLISAMIKGGHDLKVLSDAIINFNLRPWEFYEKYNIPQYPVDMIDLIEVAPGMGSLKIYGGRLHSKTLWDLPYEPSEILNDEQKDTVRDYCINDLRVTLDLYNTLKPQISLRESMSKTYGIDLRSKSDAQIAETVIKKELVTMGVNVKRPSISKDYKFRYVAPDYLKGKLGGLVDEIESIEFGISEAGGPLMPSILDNRMIKIGDTEYRMGIGGLHSSEKELNIKDPGLLSVDVASYYPSMIIKNKFYPKHLGPRFLEVYSKIYRDRITAKKEGNKVESDTKKIVLNGMFGKLGSKWSIFYSPDMFIQVTITGQLSLLLLIQCLEKKGIKVLSANTDGLVILSRDEEYCQALISKWEDLTGMTMESEPVSSLHARDVNSYIMITSKGKVKTKGAYALDGLSKNPHADIVIEGVIEYLRTGISIEEYIRSCTDIRKFVFLRKVTDGATKNGTYLGKVVRWYYAVGEDTPILTKIKGGRVSESDGGKPLMTLPEELPQDINYEKYIAMGETILTLIGVKEKCISPKKKRSTKSVSQ